MRSAALIESVPNRKEDKKPNVKMYHKFFIPVYTGEKTIVMCLVTEEQKSNKSISPTEVNLYDVIPKRESPTAETGISPARQTGRTLSEVSIRDMLSGVKGDDGKLYINADGSGNYAKILNQASTEQNTLVGIHNLSAANLRHVLKMGGLANPSIGIVDTTKQALEGYGEITLIAPTPLIDKSTGRNAGTYAADIYFPRSPSDAMYINKGKATKWQDSGRQQWPMALSISGSYGNILNEKDLVKLRQENNFILYQAAYHGSPYDFDRFDLGAIGTGEGAQAHGWGFYFAANRKKCRRI